MKRTLTLKREHVAELTLDELASVHGGQDLSLRIPLCASLLKGDCVSLSCPGATCGCCTASASC